MIRMFLLVAAAAVGSMVSAGFAAAAEAPAKAEKAAAKPDLEKARATAKQVCSACHGLDGNSATPVNPSIAGMPSQYITRQLANFKAGIRANPVMQGMAAMLSPDDMVALGLYFAQQKPKAQDATDAKLVAAGQRLYRGGDIAAGIPACAGCHAPDGAGIPRNYPRLAGQYADYTVAQLKAFKAGERGNDKDGKDVNGRIMAAIAARMSESQMRAAAAFTQGLR